MTTRTTALLAALAAALVFTPTGTAEPARKPNILWITCEDMSPNLGCYGDRYAITPNLDRFADQSVRYTHAFSVAGVCAPSRSCLITGMYPSSLGSHHMRCSAPLPMGVRCFPAYLRDAGYYCTNNSKEDYNGTKSPGTWDESSSKAHWRQRKSEQPFFSVFNLMVTHESQIGTSPKLHDPAKAPVPPFHPDTPAVRKNWASYYDQITTMDKQAAGILEQLDKDGLVEETIVFFFSDHGVGLPRGKRWLYDTGMHVPLIIRFPAKYQHLAPGKPGSSSDRLVSFVDFGPTLLSLAGVKMPAYVQGLPFLGEQAAAPREYVFGIRDRMDERYDCTRAVRDQRYKYLRNYRPELPWSQNINYMEARATTKEWRRLAAEGKLEGAAALWMAPVKPPEELYDTKADPHEIHNLATLPEHKEALRRLRAAHAQWAKDTIDLGLLPEAEIHIRAATKAPYDIVRQQPAIYPRQKILDTALLPEQGADAIPALLKHLRDEDSAVRWWAAVGLARLQAKEAVDPLKKSLTDQSPVVRVAVADALGRLGCHADALPALTDGLKHANPWIRLSAAIALDDLGDKAKPVREQLQAASTRGNNYVENVLKHALSRLGD